MLILLWLTLAIGVAPMTLALFCLPPARPPLPSVPMLASCSLLCTLAFNLTFFWQELWLVLTKAMTPGLHPVLYHNDHDWIGTSPSVELLQGAGALATLVSGLTFLAILMRLRFRLSSWRLFIAWMAFEGLFQSLSQVAIGALLPGNDVGRAFSFLGFDAAAKAAALGLAVTGMAVSGILLARHWPALASTNGQPPDRGFPLALLIPAAISILLLIPFRLPRDLIEVVAVPVVVHLLGVGWTCLGGAWNRSPLPSAPLQRSAAVGPIIILLVLLAAFQLLLAHGIAF